jgi:CHASE1-domain containing sensor protein
MQKDENNLTKKNEMKSDLYIVIILLMFLLTINFFIWQFLKNNFFTKTKSDINIISFHLAKDIEKKFEKYIELLNFGNYFFQASQLVERDEFLNYYQTPIQKYIESNQDIVMISFVEKTNKRDDFEKRIKSETTVPVNQFFYFSVYPDSASTDKYVVNYIYPWEENKRYFGYDIKSDVVFSSYFTEALEKETFVITDPGVFVNVNRLLFIQPVYNNGSPTRTIEERKAAIKGFIVLFLDSEKMFDNIVNNKDYEGIDIAIYNGKYSIGTINSHKPIYSQKNISLDKKEIIDDVEYPIIGNRTYSVYVRADISSKQNIFEKYFPDINIIVANLIVIGFIIIFIQIKSHNSEFHQ